MRPPAPGGFVLPNVNAIEDALRTVTFPISKHELLDEIDEGETVVMEGRNVELRELVRDLHDDVFESEDEFRTRLEDEYGHRASGESLPLDAPRASDQPALRDEGS